MTIEAFVRSASYTRLYEYACVEQDPILKALLDLARYRPNNWESVDQFLVDVAIGLSAARKGAVDAAVEIASRQPPGYIIPCATCNNTPTWI